MIVCCEGQTRHCYSRSLVESFLKNQPSPPPEGGEEDEDDDHIETHTLPSTLLEGKCQSHFSVFLLTTAIKKLSNFLLDGGRILFLS